MKRTIHITVVLFICLFTQIVGFSTPLSVTLAEDPICLPGITEFEGTIVDGSTFDPVSGATVSVVTIWGPFGDPWDLNPTMSIHETETSTDSSGNYELFHPNCGSENGFLKITAPGYKPTVLRGTFYIGYAGQSTLLQPAGSTATLQWAGLRSSAYGARLDPDTLEYEAHPFPTKEAWETAVDDVDADLSIQGHDPNPMLVWIVGEVDWPYPDPMEGVWLEFSKPAGWNDNDSRIEFRPHTWNHEDYLDYFDANNIDVFLQVEPGDAPIEKQIALVMGELAVDNETGQPHSSVKGFGVDVEFYDSDGDGSGDDQVTDEDAREWELRVKSFNPEYRLFLKHYFTNPLPPNYRGDIIFVDDTQDMDSWTNFKNGMTGFANAFAPNDVMYQIGYPADWYLDEYPHDFNPVEDHHPWYNDDLTTNDQLIPRYLVHDGGGSSDGLINSTDSRQTVGIIWADFTMRKLWFTQPPSPPAWKLDTGYYTDDLVTYDGYTWECVYAHTSQADWYPGAPGLWFWEKLSSGIDEWRIGQYYAPGSVVTYAGSTWECTYDHTSQADWYPGAPGLWFWQEQ